MNTNENATAASGGSQTSFGTIASLVNEHLVRHGIDIDPTRATLSMTSRIGQLAAFCGDRFHNQQQQNNNNNRGGQQQQQPTTALSVKEQDELRMLLGDLVIGLFAVSGSSGIDLGEAAMNSLGMPFSSAAATANSFQQQQQQQQPQQPVHLAAPHLQQMAAQQQMQQQQQERTGSRDPSPQFALPPAAAAAGVGGSTSTSQPGSQGASLRPVAVASQYGGSVSQHASQNASLQNHHAQQQQHQFIQQQFQQPPHHQDQSPFRNQQNNYSPQTQQQQQNLIDNDPTSVANVRAMILHIKKLPNAFSDQEFADLGLTFSFSAPNNGGQILLCENGSRVSVNSRNFGQFCELFWDAAARVEQQQQQQAGSRQQSMNRPQLDSTAFGTAANNNPESDGEAGGGADNNNAGNMLGLTSPTLRAQSGGSNFAESSGESNENNSQPQGGAAGGNSRSGSSQYRSGSTEGDLVSKEPGIEVRRFHVDMTGHPNLKQEQEGYSPSHANFGLFSPQAKAETIDVTYDASSNADSSSPKNSSPSAGGGNNNSAPVDSTSTPPQNQQQQAPVPMSSSLQDQQQQQGQEGNNNNNTRTIDSNRSTPSTAPAQFAQATSSEVASRDEFFAPRFKHLERLIADVEDELSQNKSMGEIRQLLPMYLPKEEVIALNLTFAVPFREKAVELTEGGSNMTVTNMNAKDFVTLVRDQKAVFEGRLNKKQSVKTLAVRQPHGGDLGRETGGFQSHSRSEGEDLTAPPETKATFTIDTEDAATFIPKALQREKLPVILPTASHFVAFISQHPEQFPEMFRTIRQKPSYLARWNVAYVVPDPNAPLPHNLSHTTEHNARNCGIRELINNGMSATVRESELDNYISLVLEVAPQLPYCLQPQSN